MKKTMKLVEQLSDVLITRSETVAVAESVTAGLIVATLSLANNATRFLQGGITAYNLGQKAKHLCVDPILADNSNCVSESISMQMAKEVARSFNSTWGIAITGYAVPVPALKIRNCFAFCSIVYKGELVNAERLDTGFVTQLKNQKVFVDKVFELFLRNATR